MQYPGFLFPGKTQYAEGPPPDDLEIEVLLNTVNPFNWFAAGKKLRKEKPDLIVVRYWLPFMGPCLGTVLRQVKKNRHTQVVCIADNVLPHEKRAGDNLFTRYFIRVVDRFITMSGKVMGDLRKFTNKPAQVINHPLYDNFGEPVDKVVARRALALPENRPVALFFGFIRNYKGLDILLDAMAVLRDRGGQPPLLLVAGEYYEDGKKYEDQVNKLRLGHNVIFHTNFIPDDKVRLYFSAADVVVQPYRNATQSGVTPLAYHFNVPMIVTNVGGLPQMVPDGIAGLIAAPEAASLADAMQRYFQLGKDHFLPGLIDNKQNYSWENLTKAIKGNYE